jgi:hypothetical protein
MAFNASMMIKLIYTIFKWLKPSNVGSNATCDGDPLSHPAIQAMDTDELADLPFSSMHQRRPC